MLGHQTQGSECARQIFGRKFALCSLRHTAVHAETALRTFSPTVSPVLLARRLSTASLLSSSRLLSQTTASDWMDFQNLPELSAEGRQKSLPACRGRGNTVLLQNEFLYWVITP